MSRAMYESNEFANRLGEALNSTETIVSSPRFSSRPDLDVVEEVIYKNLFWDHLAWLLKAFEVNCIIDVGANVGQYAQSLREVDYRGYIISFEPVPQYFKTLHDATTDDSYWFAYQLALGQESGVAPINVDVGTGSSFLCASTYGRERWSQLASSGIEWVTVRRLDEIWGDIIPNLSNPRPYLKLDTQGYDLEVFYGLGDRAKELVGMQSELSLLAIYEEMPDILTALEAYRQSGFDVTGMFPVTRERSTGRILELDCVMVRTSKDAESRPSQKTTLAPN